MNVTSYKTPTKKIYDYLGIEIECIIPKRSLLNKCPYCNAKVKIEYISYDWTNKDECPKCYAPIERYHYKNSLIKKLEDLKISGISVHYDGSIECDDYNKEFEIEITCLTQYSNFNNLKQLCTLLKKLGASTNESCGLHVHLDKRNINKSNTKDIDTKHLALKFLKSINYLRKVVSLDRIDNAYCRSGANLEDDDDKYYEININPKDTIEIRMHQGEIDFNNIKTWASILHKIKISNYEIKCNTYKQWFNSLKLTKKEINWYNKERKKYA